jgi:hypothetical protein
MKFLNTILPLTIALLGASCGVSTNYVAASAPTAPYQVVVVNDFKYQEEDKKANGPALTKEFTAVLTEELQNVHKFSKVTSGVHQGRALRIEGDVTLLEEGNSALRIGVGMGAGKSHFFCTARFIDNSSGKLLGTFEVQRSSKTGMAGIADNFLIVRRSAGFDIASKAVELSSSN